MAKITVTVTEELLTLIPELDAQPGDEVEISTDLVGGQPGKGPKVTD